MIAEFEQQIREYINRPRKQVGLISDAARWNRLCSALDIIGDTELALNAYLNRSGSKDIGEKYLVVYGALQVLLVQQDAVKNACNAIGISIDLPTELQEIRTIRSDSIGHPMSRKDHKVEKSNFMVRAGLSDHAFTVMSVFSDERQAQLRSYSVPKLIETQRQKLGESLGAALKLLRDEEMKHKEQHRSELLQDVFPQTLRYHLSKLQEATYGGPAFQRCVADLNVLRDCLKEFRRALEKRDEWGVHNSIDYHMELVEYPIERLSEYFSEHENNRLNGKDAYIFCTFIEQQFNKLRNIAAEIDEDYMSTPDGAG